MTPAGIEPATFWFVAQHLNRGPHYSNIKKVKVKWSRYRPGVARRVGRGIALLFHDRDTRRGWVVSSTPRPLFTPGKDPVPILQEPGWAPGPVWTGGKSRPHQDAIPDSPARSQSLYRLSYRAHIKVILLFIIIQYIRSPDLSQNSTARLSVLHSTHICIVSNNYSKCNTVFGMWLGMRSHAPMALSVLIVRWAVTRSYEIPPVTWENQRQFSIFNLMFVLRSDKIRLYQLFSFPKYLRTAQCLPGELWFLFVNENIYVPLATAVICTENVL